MYKDERTLPTSIVSNGAVLRKRATDEEDRDVTQGCMKTNGHYPHASFNVYRAVSVILLYGDPTRPQAARTGIGHNRVRRQARYRRDIT
jgi:hypothetical protein